MQNNMHAQNNTIFYSNHIVDRVFNISETKPETGPESNTKLLEEMQSHTFTVKNLTHFTKYKTSKKEEKTNKLLKMQQKEIHKKDIFEPMQKDTLFWCLYVLAHGFGKYDMLGNQHFVEEKQWKFKYIELLRTKKDILKMHKIRPLTELEDDLANKQQIGIKTFVALCILTNLNVMIINKHKYFESINNDSNIVHIIYTQDEPLKYSLDLICTHEKLDKYRKSYYKMPSFDASIKSMTSYKHEELVELSSKLGIEIPSDPKNANKKKTKKEIYELIILNF